MITHAHFASMVSCKNNINKQQQRGSAAIDKSKAQSDSAAAAVFSDTIKLLHQKKQSLRKRIRSRMKSTYYLSTDETDRLITQSNAVFARLFTLPEYESAQSIGFFLSMPSGEIQTRNAIRKIVEEDNDKTLYVPRVGLDLEKCEMDMVRCETAASGDRDTDGKTVFYDAWPRNKWGIPEPPVSTTDVAKPGDIDLLIVPGLAFDTHGHRLGQGKGYYDRFIVRMHKYGHHEEEEDARPFLVGVCLEEQFLEEVPREIDLGGVDRDDASGGIIPISDHDYIMDMVLSPSRTLVVPK